MNRQMGAELSKQLNIDIKNISGFQNRGGHFPGETLIFSNSKTISLDRKLHRAFYRMYSPIRCWSCTDFGNEMADISVADCWEKEEKSTTQFKFPEGAAWVLIRSDRGNALLNDAINLKRLHFIETKIDINDENWRESFLHRKVRGHTRLEHFKKFRWPTPNLDYEYTKELDGNLFKKDETDIFFIRLFKSSKRIRLLFLKLWISLSKSNSPSLRFIYAFLGTKVFTHRSDKIVKPSLILPFMLMNLVKRMFTNLSKKTKYNFIGKAK